MKTPPSLPRPALVGASADPAALLAAAQTGDADARACDALELRLDLALARGVPANELPALATALAASRPLILCARAPSEGGAGALPPERRIAALRDCAPAARIVDMEIAWLRADPQARALAAELRAEGTIVIGSHHDFADRPDAVQDAEGACRAAIAEGLPVDWLKVALRMEGAEAQRAAFDRLLPLERERPIALMGMGAAGRDSRWEAWQAGCPLIYAAVGEPNAPGQWPAAELRAAIAGKERGPAQGRGRA